MITAEIGSRERLLSRMCLLAEIGKRVEGTNPHCYLNNKLFSIKC